MPFLARFAWLALAASAAAGTEGEAPAVRHWTLTYDPFLPAVATFQVTAEFRPGAHWSGALIAGGGSGENYFRSYQESWRQIGAQARWYPRPPGRYNPHAFSQLLWERAWYEKDSVDQGFLDARYVDDVVAALGWGWKFMGRIGLTVELQVGLSAWFGKDAGDRAFSAVAGPYANSGLGWSF